jgi:hypothetical protein
MTGMNRRVEISITNVSFVTVNKINSNLLGSRNISCGDGTTCIFSTLRNISSINNLTFPFYSLSLNDYNYTSIYFPINLKYNVSASILQSNNSQDQSYKADVQLGFQGNNLTNYTLYSPSISLDKIEYNPPNGFCINGTLTEHLYELSINYKASASIKIYNNSRSLIGNDLGFSTRQILGNVHNFTTENNVAKTFFSGTINANTVQPIMDNILPAPCNITDNDTVVVSPNPQAITNSSVRDHLQDYNILRSNTTFLARFAYETFDYLTLKTYDCFRALGAVWFIYPIFFWARPTGGHGTRDSKISGKISQYFNKDPFDLVTFGNFIDKRINETRQIVINDIQGVKIISQDGQVLYENTNFCNQPFIEIKPIYDNKCGPDSSPITRLGVDCTGTYSCELYNFYHIGVFYQVSFNAYNNHNKHFGGIKVGDYDGDGLDDLLCHYPGTTLNYNTLKSNQVIFAPLHNSTSNLHNRNAAEKQKEFCDDITDFYIQNWCKDGVIKVGDFDGDYKDDVLCIENDSKFYMQYGEGGQFVSASSEESGFLDFSSVHGKAQEYIQGWNINKKIIVGDFNGDKKADLFMIEDLKILSSISAGGFYYTQPYFKDSTIIERCKGTSVNRVTAIPQNGGDKIACFLKDGSVLEFVVPLSKYMSYAQVALKSGETAKKILKTSIRKFDIQNTNAPENIANQQNATDISSLRKLWIFVNEVNIESPINLADAKENSITANHNFKLYSEKKSNFKISPTTTLKIIKNIYFPNDLIDSDNYDVEINFKYLSDLTLPQNNIWASDDVNANNQLHIDVSAKWQMSKGEISTYKVESNEIDLYALNSFASGKNCFNTTLAQKYKTLQIDYSATATMQIEDNGIMVTGKELKQIVSNILGEYEITQESDEVLFNVNGYVDINIPGTSFSDMVHCD